MKKIISMLMVVVMVLSLGSVSVFADEGGNLCIDVYEPFDDVSVGDYFYDTVIWAVENGITTGTSETTFSPNETCTYNQILTFLWRANESPIAAVDDRLNWVIKDEYFTEAVRWMAAEGYIDRFFAGESPCTRGAVVKYLYYLSGEKDYDISSADKFTDVSVELAKGNKNHSDYVTKEAIAWAVDNGITSGTSETTFSPYATCTRAQIVTFLYRAYANR